MKEEELQAGTTGTSHLRSGKAREPSREGRGHEGKREAATKKHQRNFSTETSFYKRGLIIPTFGNDEVVARRISAKW